MKNQIVEIIQTWDTAFQDKTSADYSVCITGGRGRLGNKLYILDMWRGKVEWPGLVRAAHEQYDMWSPSRIIVENKASGQSLIQELRDKGLPAFGTNPEGDKYYRASAVTGMVESGMVHLPYGEPWVDDLVEELAEFPPEKDEGYDDIVDAVAMFLQYFKRRVNRSDGKSVIGGEKKNNYVAPAPNQTQPESRKIITGRKSSIWRR